MAGFPDRPGRAAFGPDTFEDAIGVENPKQDVGASQFTLMMWQIAGMGRVVPRAVIMFSVSAAPDFDSVLFQALAWDPKAALGAVTIVRTGAGIYEITFATTYPDENGTARTLALIGGLAGTLSTTARPCQVNKTADNVVEVRVFDSAGAPADPASSNVLVALW